MTKKEKWKRILSIIMIIWLSKIAICVGIREHQNSKFLQMYANCEDGIYDLNIERKFHFLSWKYGVIGISYHYTVDVYDFVNRSEYIGTKDRGIFRISLVHYGYIQEAWPLAVYKDYDITNLVQPDD
ncbi:MAG: hypothetical protein E7292_06030 [Lachnospiraceae bacterium]|nr:hypothetical protein [Lachnospiraceae bacterium]